MQETESKEFKKNVFVLSSLVGPKPPVITTKSDFSIALLSEFLIFSILSEIDVTRKTSIPILLNSFDSFSDNNVSLTQPISPPI